MLTLDELKAIINTQFGYGGKALQELDKILADQGIVQEVDADYLQGQKPTPSWYRIHACVREVLNEVADKEMAKNPNALIDYWDIDKKPGMEPEQNKRHAYECRVDRFFVSLQSRIERECAFRFKRRVSGVEAYVVNVMRRCMGLNLPVSNAQSPNVNPAPSAIPVVAVSARILEARHHAELCSATSDAQAQKAARRLVRAWGASSGQDVILHALPQKRAPGGEEVKVHLENQQLRQEVEKLRQQLEALHQSYAAAPPSYVEEAPPEFLPSKQANVSEVAKDQGLLDNVPKESPPPPS